MKPIRWQSLVLILFGLGLAMLLFFVAVSIWPQSTPGTMVGTGEDSPRKIPLAVDKSLGVNADLSLLDSVEREKALAAMEACGLRWLRQRFAWDVIEPQRGVYTWAVWDGIVDGAAQHDLGLIAVLDGSPAWARRGEDMGSSLAPPAEPRDFGDFVAAFAARYGDRVDYYQVWDEPNITPHWGAGAIDPAGYVRLLREAAIRIRSADPGAVVLAAALAPNVEPGGANMSDLVFLDALYRQGGAEWFDVLGMQPYAFLDPLDAAPDPDRLNWQRVELLREVMESHGDARTAAWAVSFGFDEDADLALADGVGKARADWPWMGPMLWAAWSPDDVHGQYALLGGDGDPSPSLEPVCALAGAPAVAWPGVYPADHPSGRYEGSWLVTEAGADIGNSGDRLTISFHGTRLDLAVRRGDYRAFLYVTVDGQAANALPRDTDGRAYAVLYDPLREGDAITLAENLPDGEHTAEIVAERGWGQWAIIGWAVVREAPGAFPWLAGALSLAAFVVLGATVARAWTWRYELLGTWSLLFSRYRSLDERWALMMTAGATVCVYIIEGTLPSLVALVALMGLLLLRPRTGLPLVAVMLPFYQLGKPLLGKLFSMVEIVTALTAVGWLANVLVSRIQRPTASELRRDDVARGRLPVRRIHRLSSLDWGVLALVAVGAASLLWSEHVREAAREYRTVVLGAGLFYGSLRISIPSLDKSEGGSDWRDAWRVVDAWVLGGVLVAAVGIWQWASGQGVITAEGVSRVRGFYGSPNNLALYLVRVFPLAVALAVWGRCDRASRLSLDADDRNRWLRLGCCWAYRIGTVVMVAALILTYSRGAWLLGVPAALLFLAAMRGRRAFFVAIGVLLIAAVLLMLIVGSGRLTSLLDTTEGTTFFRLQLWQSSWAMIVDHPVLGVGLDNFLYEYRSHYVLPTAWEEFNLSHPHNLVLDFWLRLGLPGLAILAWLLIGFFRKARGMVHRLAAGDERLLILGLMAGMVGSVAHGLVDNAFFLVDLAFAFVLMLALVQVPAHNSGRSVVSECT